MKTEHDQVQELLPGYALDCLDRDEMMVASEHVAECVICQAEVEKYRAVVGQLALATPVATPSPAVRRRLMKRLGLPRPGANAGTQPSVWRAVLGFTQRTAPVWGALSFVLVLTLAIANLLLWQQYTNRANVQPTTAVQIVRMVSTNAAPAASAVIAISNNGQYGTLIVEGLPPLDPDRQYQLWLIQDGKRTSGAVFSVNEDGYSSAPISSPQAISIYSAFGITIEPAGGSPGPTGPKVLGSAT
jgi:anti-sigma-K factor RskA